MNYLQELQREAIQLQFGKKSEDSFFKKVSFYAQGIYNYMLLVGYPNARYRLQIFLYSLGQNRVMLRDSRTFYDGKKGIMKDIVDLQKELEK